MKAAFSIAFSTFYLLITIGVQVNIHYCFDRVESVNFYQASKKCCCAHMAMASSCCNDETITIQSEDEHQGNTAFRLISLTEVISEALVFKFSQQEVGFAACSPKFFYTDSSPPPKLPLWLLNCTLTYYG